MTKPSPRRPVTSDIFEKCRDNLDCINRIIIVGQTVEISEKHSKLFMTSTIKKACEEMRTPEDREVVLDWVKRVFCGEEQADECAHTNCEFDVSSEGEEVDDPLAHLSLRQRKVLPLRQPKVPDLIAKWSPAQVLDVINYLDAHIKTASIQAGIPELYDEVAELMDPKDIIGDVIGMLQGKKKEKTTCSFVDANCQSGKTAIKRFYCTVVASFGPFNLKHRPWTVLIGQFVSHTKKFMAVFTKHIREIVKDYVTSRSLFSDEYLIDAVSTSGGTVFCAKSSSQTFERAVEHIETTKDSNPCIVILDEADVFVVQEGNYLNQQLLRRAQTSATGFLAVSATMLGSLLDCFHQDFFTFGNYFVTREPSDYYGHQHFVRYKGRTLQEGTKPGDFPEEMQEFYDDALSQPYAVVMSATTRGVTKSPTFFEHLEAVGLNLPQKSFIGIAAHGSNTPLPPPAVRFFGERAEEFEETLRAKFQDIDCTLAESQGGYFCCKTLNPLLKDVNARLQRELGESYVSPFEKDPKAKKDEAGLGMLCLVLTTLREVYREIPIVVAGFTMLRRSLSIVGVSSQLRPDGITYKKRPLAAVTHILSLSPKSQTANDAVQHLNRAAGRSAVKIFHEQFNFPDVEVLTTEQSLNALEGLNALRRWDGRNPQEVYRTLFEMKERFPGNPLGAVKAFCEENPEFTLPSAFQDMLNQKIPPFSKAQNRRSIAVVEDFLDKTNERTNYRKVERDAKRANDLLWEAAQTHMYLQDSEEGREWWTRRELGRMFEDVDKDLQTALARLHPKVRGLLEEYQAVELQAETKESTQGKKEKEKLTLEGRLLHRLRKITEYTSKDLTPLGLRIPEGATGGKRNPYKFALLEEVRENIAKSLSGAHPSGAMPETPIHPTATPPSFLVATPGVSSKKKKVIFDDEMEKTSPPSSSSSSSSSAKRNLQDALLSTTSLATTTTTTASPPRTAPVIKRSKNAADAGNKH